MPETFPTFQKTPFSGYLRSTTGWGHNSIHFFRTGIKSTRQDNRSILTIHFSVLRLPTSVLRSNLLEQLLQLDLVLQQVIQRLDIIGFRLKKLRVFLVQVGI
jgi:hypothetical protein